MPAYICGSTHALTPHGAQDAFNIDAALLLFSGTPVCQSRRAQSAASLLEMQTAADAGVGDVSRLKRQSRIRTQDTNQMSPKSGAAAKAAEVLDLQPVKVSQDASQRAASPGGSIQDSFGSAASPSRVSSRSAAGRRSGARSASSPAQATSTSPPQGHQPSRARSTSPGAQVVRDGGRAEVQEQTWELKTKLAVTWLGMICIRAQSLLLTMFCMGLQSCVSWSALSQYFVCILHTAVVPANSHPSYTMLRGRTFSHR